jgi:hypothetical protein
MQKAIMEVEDFNKLTKFVTTRTVNFLEAEKAVEILTILKRVKIAEVEEPKAVKDGK